MLYRLHTNIFLVGLLSIGILAALVPARSGCVMTAGTVLAFITQVALLLYFCQQAGRQYSGRNLLGTVLAYGFLMAAVFMAISYYYEGDTFMFSKSDARLYYTNSMKSAELGFWDNAARLIRKHEFDDWGALLFDSLLMAIIPSKLFLNAVYIVSGAVSSVLLFRLGRRVMPDAFAFCSALAYGTSSFLIFFHCTFLKESIFVFLVICAMYFFYEAVGGGGPWAYIWTALFLGLIVFFRPAVSAMLVIAFLAHFAVSQRGTALSVFLYLIMGALLVFSLSTIQDMVDTYTGGDVDAMIEYGTVGGYSSSFSLFVSSFAAPFGPFPSLFPKVPGEPLTINFYGAGLTYKLFLTVPMWLGVFYAIKHRDAHMIPLITYILVGMVATAYVMASLELRKVMTHIPFTYTLAFYGLYRWDTAEKPLLREPVFHLFAVGVLALWNVIRG